MVLVAALGFALTIQGQSTVHFAPPNGSPFVLRGDHIDFSSKQNVLESQPGGQPGIFIIRESHIDETTYDHAIEELNGARVGAIVRRTSPGKYEAWNLSGHPITMQEANAPTHILQKLTDGQIAIKVTQPTKPGRSERPSHLFQFSSSSINFTNGSVDMWTTVAPPKCKAVDVLLSVSGHCTVGKIDPKLGTEAEIDGTRFQVIDEKLPSKSGFKNVRRIFQYKQLKAFSYFFGIEYDEMAYARSLPKGSYTGLSTSGFSPAVQSEDVPKGATEIYVSSNVPCQFWTSLNVQRHFTLNGYVGQVPTEPKITP